MVKTCFAGIVSALVLAGTAVGQTITQAQFLERLIQSHPLFDKEALNSDIEQSARASLRGAEDWHLSGEAFLSHEQPALSFAGPEKTTAVQLSAGLERLYWGTGGRLRASVSASRADLTISPAFMVPGTIYQHKVELSYSHPLMRNKGGFLDRLNFDLRKYEIEISELQSDEALENFLAGSALKYLEWTFLEEQRKIVDERLRLSEVELDRTQRKRNANLVDVADVLRAEDAVRTWRAEQVFVAARKSAIEAELLVLTQDSLFAGLSPEFDLYAVAPRPPLPAAVATIRSKSRSLELIKIRKQQLVHSRKGLDERGRPDLSLVALANAKRADGEFVDALGLNKPDAQIGLRLSVPLERRSSRADVQRTDLQIQQLEEAEADLALTLTSAYTSIHIQIEQLQEVLRLNREQITSAGDRTAEELKLYEQGRGELTFVIASRDSEQRSKLTLATNALFIQQLIVQADALLDLIYSGETSAP